MTIPSPTREPPSRGATPVPSTSVDVSAKIQWETSEAVMHARVRRERRPTLVYLRADWSTASLRMEREVWTHPQVIYALANFVALWLDVSSTEPDAEAMAASYGATELPSVVLFHASGSRAQVLSGPLDAQTLLVALQALDGSR